MATFYIQLENKLLQISGDLTAENISKALGYVPVSPNVTNELSQRVDNITFDSLKDNPFLQDGSGELNIVDEAGNIIAKVSSEGIRTIEVLVGEHRLSEKANKTEIPTKLSDLANDTNYITIADIPPVEIPSLDEYVTEAELQGKGYLTQHQDISHLATRAEVVDIDFYDIKNNPVINSGDGKLLFVDESGNIGLQLENNGLYVSNVFAGNHILSNKADKSEIPTATSQLTNDSGYITKPVVDQAVAALVNSAPETLDTIGEIASALKNNAGIVDVLNQSISSKQDIIEDLNAIRAGASLGLTSIQEIPEEYVTRDEIPSLDEYAKKEEIPSLGGYATQVWVNNKNYATEEDIRNIDFSSLQNNPLVEDTNGEFNLVDDSGNVGFKVNQEGLFVKEVTAGDHVLSAKQDIISDLDIIRQGASKGDTAVQPEDLPSETYLVDFTLEDLRNGMHGAYQISCNLPGLINAIQANKIILIRRDYGFSGVHVLNGYVEDLLYFSIVDELGVIIYCEGTPYTSAYNYIDGQTLREVSAHTKQDRLVSGANIKTINGESILGSGNLSISGGSSAANVQAVDTGDVLDDVNVEYATTAYVDNKVANINLTAYATTTYVDGLVGDINSVLESIINGGGTSLFPIVLTAGDNGQYGIDIFNYLCNIISTKGENNSYDLLETEHISVDTYTFTSLWRSSETTIVLNPAPAGYLFVHLSENGYITLFID